MCASGRCWAELDFNGAALADAQVVAIGNHSTRRNRRAGASNNSEVSYIGEFDRDDINEIARSNSGSYSRARKRDRLARTARAYGVVPEIQIRSAHRYRCCRHPLSKYAAGAGQTQEDCHD